ncbi:MAG: DUF362 domain-containing protein [Verrucomicrobiae bacterium]|nr:DUF362 domain-containing protein [Verrucomicrobiae bacterium]
MKKQSRRAFLNRLLLGSALLSPAARLRAQADRGTSPAPLPSPGTRPLEVPPPLSRVVLCQNPGAIVRFEYNDAILWDMTRKAVAAYFGKDPVTAFRELLKPEDVVGIKVNSAPGPLVSTSRAMVLAIIDLLERAGVPRGNIVIWDKFRTQLDSARYTIADRNGAMQVIATVPEAGYDAKPTYDFEVTGTLIWGDRDFDAKKAMVMTDGGTNPLQLSTKSHFTNILTQRITKCINMPSLTDHPDYGIAGCLYNMAIGSTDNSRRFGVSPYYGVPPIPDIYSMPMIRNKTILNLMDATIICFAGGPGFNANYCDQACRLYVSQDPVAIDALCLTLLKDLRKSAGISTPPWFGTHVNASAKARLGTDDPSKMDLTVI